MDSGTKRWKLDPASRDCIFLSLLRMLPPELSLCVSVTLGSKYPGGNDPIVGGRDCVTLGSIQAGVMLLQEMEIRVNWKSW